MKSESWRCSHVWYMTHAKKSPTSWGTIPPNVGFHSPRQGEILSMKMVFFGTADIIRGFMVSLYVKGKENGEVRTIRNETTYPIHGKYPLKHWKSSVLVRACPWLLSFATDVHRLTRNYALINKRSLHCPIPKETPAFPCVPLAPLRENSRKLVFPMTKAWQNTRGHRPYCRVLHGKLFLLNVVSINICA